MNKLLKMFEKMKKTMVLDFIFNISASAVLTLSTQLIAYPYISRVVTAEDYGVLLTLMGITNAIGVAIGNPLNNTRILLQNVYSEKQIQGDFNVIFLRGLILNVVAVVISSWVILGSWNRDILFITIISALILFRSYYSVYYRLVIDFKKYLFSSLFGLIGYLIGIYVGFLFKEWLLVFVLGELFTSIFIFITSKSIIFEKIEKTCLFSVTLKKYRLIMSAALISTIMTYMDRFFIYPFLGAEDVGLYNIASFLGKTSGIILIPISGVLLSYYAKETALSLKAFLKRLLVFSIFSLILYIAILFFGKPVTELLYPTLYKQSLAYYDIANLATIINVLGTTLQPILLRYCKSSWQPIIQIIYLAVYLIFGILGMLNNGLLGFCYAVLIANSIKLITMILIVLYSYWQNGNKVLT